MAETTQKVRLEFRCDQDFNKMAIGADGKPFCEMCQKSLVDFRSTSLKEVARYTQEKSGCGVFKAEHIETDMVYHVGFTSFRKYFLALSTLLFAEIGNAQAGKDTTKQNSEIIDSFKSNKIEKTKQGIKSSENGNEASCVNEKSNSKIKKIRLWIVFQKKTSVCKFP